MRTRYDLCPDCKVRLVKDHWNAKRCGPCAKMRVSRPHHAMTPAQVRQALALRGKCTRKEVARRVGVTDVAINRLGRELGVSFSAKPYSTNPGLVARVAAYYARHGRQATQKRFPDVCVRSIVERYPHRPRQARWTDEQIVQAARMAGLVSAKRQAEMFNRPNAREGSIKSLWAKRFGRGGAHIHGLSKHAARALLRPGFPTVATQFWAMRHWANDLPFSREIVLWCDVEKWLLPGTPDFLRDAVRTMADFQRWLFKTETPRRAILALLRKAGGNV
jgi:hypothetical protein